MNKVSAIAIKQNSQKGIIQLILILLVLAVISGGAFLFFTLKGNDLIQKFMPSVKQTATRQPDAKSEAQISINDKGFIPQVLTIKKGTQVSWVNNDSKPHQVASDPHPTHTLLPGLDSKEPLKTKDSYSFIFEKPGTFTYHDHLNPFSFKGTVIVE